MSGKRFKKGDKVRVLPYDGFSEKGKKLVGLEGIIVSNPGGGSWDVMLFVDGMKDNIITAHLEAAQLEQVT